jgi:hypothetical protein
MSDAHRRRQHAGAVALFLLLVLPGCTSFELARLRNGIARDARTLEVGDGYSLSFGRASLGLARFGVGLGDDGTDSSGVNLTDLLGSVQRVHFAQYPIRRRDTSAVIGRLPTLERYERRGWTPLLVLRENGAETFVYARDRRGALHQGLVVSLAENRLTLVQVRGNLDEALRSLLSGSGAFGMGAAGALPALVARPDSSLQ